MATAAYHLVRAVRFLRRARAPTAGNPPDAAAEVPRPPSTHPVHKPLPHPGRHCAAARFRRLRRPAPAPIPDASLRRHPGRRNPESGRFRRRCLPRASRPPPLAATEHQHRRPDSAMPAHYTPRAAFPFKLSGLTFRHSAAGPPQPPEKPGRPVSRAGCPPPAPAARDIRRATTAARRKPAEPPPPARPALWQYPPAHPSPPRPPPAPN